MPSNTFIKWKMRCFLFSILPFSYVRENELPVESEDAPLLPEPDEALELHADDEGFRCEPGEREGKKRLFYQAVRFPYLKKKITFV